jgi:hypothetical protein
MIVHVAPRRVALISKDRPQSDVSIELSTVLGVALETDAEPRVNLVVRLTNGARVIACTYARMSEAGPDCGKLRVLAGLPAWTGSSAMTGPEARWPPHRPVLAASNIISATVSFASAIMSRRGHGCRSCNAGRGIFSHAVHGQGEGSVAR